MSLKPTQPGVSIDINCAYVRPAKLGETIEISLFFVFIKISIVNPHTHCFLFILVLVGTSLKSGKTLALADVSIRRKDDKKLVAVGRHSKQI
jgi:acyl-coenzyme A thioesterase PaaI-like protein